MIPPANPRHVFPWTSAARSRARRSRARAAFRPRIEAFEDRLLPAVFTVTVADDTGPGSLRQALLDANANPGPDAVAFDIGGGGVQTIRPASALPAVTGPVTIDGATQPGYAGSPLIVLDGSKAGANVNGLRVNADGSAVLALVIGGFTASGVMLFGSNNRVEGCYLGTDVTGTKPLANAMSGVTVVNGVLNVVGGAKPGAGNLIAGNRRDGVFIFAYDNRVEGNAIGTDVTGTAALGNGANGVYIDVSVGAGAAVVGNLVSGNAQHGVSAGAPSTVQGNFIGTDVTGTRALPNGGHGVSTGIGGLLGGTAPGAGNLISGNGMDGVNLNIGGRVQGNLIGTDVTGTRTLPNGGHGVSLFEFVELGGPAPGAGNLIAGNLGNGVHVRGWDNRVQGNTIGTDATGTRALGNAVGVFFATQTGLNLVGGAAPGAGNLIAGNRLEGVFLDGSFMAGSGHRVEGNTIGTDVTGTKPLGNIWGVFVNGGTGHAVGGSAPGAGNLISGNRRDGVFVAARGTRVQGNRIGTDAGGTRAVGNGFAGVTLAAEALVGGPGAGNVISGNRGDGVRITGAGGRVEGNLIGTDITGAAALANAGRGVSVSGDGNFVGGPGAGNLISGNAQDGVFIFAANNRVEGNTIGTDATGTAALGNSRGVALGSQPGDDARENVVAGNLISGNRSDGVLLVGRDNRLEGNLIGTDAAGKAALGNGFNGVTVLYGEIGAVVAGNLVSGNARHGVAASANGGTPAGAPNRVEGNLIGTDASGTAALANGLNGVSANFGAVVAGNLISGNQGDGVAISGRDSQVTGNLIGTDVTGTVALGNNRGVVVGTTAVVVGGPGAGNLIAGNRGAGVEITGTGHRVQGNLVGTDVTGRKPLGNGGNGVTVQGTTAASNNVVGGPDAGAGNAIAFNGGAGVLVVRGGGNAVRQNAIFANAGLGIELRPGANNDQAAPDLASAVSGGGLTRVAGTLRSTPNTTFTVELFASAECDPSGFGEGEQFLMSFTATTDAAGLADFAVEVGVEVPPGHFVTATATDPAGNTSAFAQCREVAGRSGGAGFPLGLLRARAGAAGAP